MKWNKDTITSLITAVQQMKFAETINGFKSKSKAYKQTIRIDIKMSPLQLISPELQREIKNNIHTIIRYNLRNSQAKYRPTGATPLPLTQHTNTKPMPVSYCS